MCGGFTCSKNALIALNLIYIVVACILIIVAAYGRTSTQVQLPIVGGILACGILLILIAILGLYGAAKHHQVVLFFYMIILFLLFLIQFSVACACLAVTTEQKVYFAKEGWNTINETTRGQIQHTFSCCGYNPSDTSVAKGPVCGIENACCVAVLNGAKDCDCPPCKGKLEDALSYVFKLCGGIGLFFSFTEILAVLVAYRYRNLYDPFDKLPAANIPRNYLY